MGRPKGASPRKKNKDVNKPKRASSAYFFYLAHCRAEANKAGRSISKIAEFTKECSAKWRELTDAKKKPFNEQAAKDKARYDQQMAAYKGKSAVDPDKPKRPMTAYFMFLGDFREKMKNRGVDHKEMLRLAGEEWRGMNAEQKKPYEKRSVEAGKKYEEAMAAYRSKTEGKARAPPAAMEDNGADDDDDEEEEDDEEEDDDEDDDE